MLRVKAARLPNLPGEMFSEWSMCRQSSNSLSSELHPQVVDSNYNEFIKNS
jgi:hypothetical protein